MTGTHLENDRARTSVRSPAGLSADGPIDGKRRSRPSCRVARVFGKTVWVNLTAGSVRETEEPASFHRRFLGGQAWAPLPAARGATGTDPFSPRASSCSRRPPAGRRARRAALRGLRALAADGALAGRRPEATGAELKRAASAR